MEAKDLWHGRNQEKKEELIPLTMAPPGKEVTLIAIEGGKGIKARLYSMGITPGIRLRILSNGAPGPFIVEARESKVALGYGMAKKIMVK